MKTIPRLSRKATMAALYGAAICSMGGGLFAAEGAAASPKLKVQTAPISRDTKLANLPGLTLTDSAKLKS